MTAANFTPREIVSELDRYIIGQAKAKRAVAIALRNRWRRRQVGPELRDEITPKNIIMIGPTGIGKTEIARRLAKLANAPFIKVEASKFTEVGYVGKDVESIVRELTDHAVKMVREEETAKVQVRAGEAAEDRCLDLLLHARAPSDWATQLSLPADAATDAIRARLKEALRQGRLEGETVELPAAAPSVLPMVEVVTPSGLEEMANNLREMFGQMTSGGKKRRRVRVPEAMQMLTQEEAAKLIDTEGATKLAVERVEQNGIVFLDEIDKIAGQGGKGFGPDVSREGVQRDILPIVEGSTVATKYGMVRTDHILFIAAGAFHAAKPSDLIPELQGRFPIRVELDPLTKDDFYRIVTETHNALPKQYRALMGTEGVDLRMTDDALREICEIAVQINEQTENIGARRLHTVMERVLEETAFHASERRGERIEITADYVRTVLQEVVKDRDLSRYIL
ncbi:MAG: ATP-dependent protease ATPase subunit HslU [Deltaproteobacteria bacterium]|nr:ATP-dependent protease ATPase subunit HslU [Deltaproteobacteria bacterium]